VEPLDVEGMLHKTSPPVVEREEEGWRGREGKEK